jgi:hypothetical protein
MKQVSVLSGITFIGLLIVGCGKNNNASLDTKEDRTANFDIANLKKIIDEKNNRFTQAHITGDTAFLNNIFTLDARVFAPNSEVVVGRSAIALVNLEYINFGITEFREETTALYGNEDYLINEGSYFMIYGNDNTIDEGKFINIWKKTDGDWKLFSNIWNTNIPVTPANLN